MSRISFIKVDAEGFDLEVLRSIEAIIRQQSLTYTSKRIVTLPMSDGKRCGDIFAIKATIFTSPMVDMESSLGLKLPRPTL